MTKDTNIKLTYPYINRLIRHEVSQTAPSYQSLIEAIEGSQRRCRERTLDMEDFTYFLSSTLSKFHSAGISRRELDGSTLEHLFYYETPHRNYTRPYFTSAVYIRFELNHLSITFTRLDCKTHHENELHLSQTAALSLIKNFAKDF